jgi:hypothetical protein
MSNEEEFYLKYLAPGKVPRFPQNNAMSVGSAFDAYVKVYISTKLYGKNDPRSFDFDQLFEKQVEPHNRDFAKKAGAACYLAYKQSGALEKLMSDLFKSPMPPRMEFTSTNKVDEHGNVMNAVSFTEKARFLLEADGTLGPDKDLAVLLGKPDLHFQTSKKTDVISDWKVNGYCSQSGKKPTPGYILLLEGFTNQTKNHGKQHKDSVPSYDGDFEYSLTPNIEIQDQDWARQIATYSWLAGCPVGSDIIVGIDQLCCLPSFPNHMISVALHRCTVTEAFQIKTYKLYQELWDRMHSDWFFRERTREQSQERCAILDKQAAIYDDATPHAKYLRSLRGVK